MVEDEAMNHKPYHDWMQSLLDGALAPADRRALEEHLAGCDSCQAAWASLSNIHRLLKAEPMLAPRAGFSGRFQARLAQRRASPQARWGALALGLGAVAASALVVPLGLGTVLSAVSVARQPDTSLALVAGAAAAGSFATRLAEALLLVARALAEAILPNPLTWAACVMALSLAIVWLYVMRRLAPEVKPQ
jgi:anti-sigma factor RsiW